MAGYLGSYVTNTLTGYIDFNEGKIGNQVNFPTGHIIQVQSTAKTSAFDTQSTTYTPITGLSVDIDPTYENSEFLIQVQLTHSAVGDDIGHYYINLTNSISGAIFTADLVGSRTSATIVGNFLQRQMLTVPIIYKDSPNTLQTITYGLEVKVASSGQTYTVNRSGRDEDLAIFDGRATSSITVFELVGT